MLSHMGGNPAQTALLDWLQLDPSEWCIVLRTPGLEVETVEDLQSLVLNDSQAISLGKYIKS